MSPQPVQHKTNRAATKIHLLLAAAATTELLVQIQERVYQRHRIQIIHPDRFLPVRQAILKATTTVILLVLLRAAVAVIHPAVAVVPHRAAVIPVVVAAAVVPLPAVVVEGK